MEKSPYTRRWLQACVPVLFCLIGLVVFFRAFIFSGGELVTGGIGDGQFIQSVHEHWYKVARGEESWSNLNFYYPVKNTLGHSDTFLLTGIPYTVLRLLGVEAYIAFQTIQMLLALAGFWGMYAWLSKLRGFSNLVASWGALLFIIASPFYVIVRNSHIQMLYAWLIPLILVLAELAWRHRHTGKAKFSILFAGLCGLLGLITYSTFYPAFFLGFMVLLGILGALVLFDTRRLISGAWELRRLWLAALPGILVLLLSGALFLWTYYPVSKLMDGWPLQAIVANMSEPWNMFNHSTTNLLWGNLNSVVWAYPPIGTWSLEVAPAPLTIAVSLACMVMLFRQRKSARPAHLLAAVALAGGMLFSIRIGQVSLWMLAYHLLPGADVIRDVTRMNIVLMVPAVLLACQFMETLFKSLTGVHKSVMVLCPLLILLEQVQLLGGTEILRTERHELIASSPPPPPDIEAFYAFGEPLWEGFYAISQNEAVLLSQHWKLPTINGGSGIQPPDWGLYNMRPGTAFPILKEWLAKRDIKGKIALYDLVRKRWLRVLDPNATVGTFSTGDDLLSLPPNEFSRIAKSGWSTPEHWGVWSLGKVSTVEIPPVQWDSSRQLLYLELSAFVPDSLPQKHLKISVNGEWVGELDFDQGNNELSTQIPLQLVPGEPVSVGFEVDPVESPKSLGLNEDNRPLGIGLKSLRILDGPYPGS